MRVFATAAVLVGLTLTGCDLGDSGNAKIKSAKDKGATSQTSQPSDTTTDDANVPDPGIRPTVDNLGLKLIVKSKSCFGSAGCNIEYNVAVQWKGVGKAHFNDDYDIKYAVAGDESGPQIDTLTIHPNGKYDVPYGGFLSTSSSYTKLGVRIVHISKHVGY